MSALFEKYRSCPKGEKRAIFYSQVLLWAKSLIRADQTILIGVNGPQGCGKSTLCQAMVEASKVEAFRSATLSIDDFYLTRAEQVALASKNFENPYLQQRGYPGTHDIRLGRDTLVALKKLKTRGEVLCPQYDKSAYQGQGDRFPQEKWKIVEGPIDVLFFEGWMLGFPIERYEPWHALLDGFLFLEPEQIDYVIDWRVEAEVNRKAEGKTGMTKEEITSYVKKFIPAYELYIPQLKNSLSERKNALAIKIARDRLPVQKSPM